MCLTNVITVSIYRLFYNLLKEGNKDNYNGCLKLYKSNKIKSLTNLS